VQLAAGQDISSKLGVAMLVRAPRLGMEAPANLPRAKKTGIDAGGSVARPESTIPGKSLFIWVEP
jgi:hypothetical protein